MRSDEERRTPTGEPTGSHQPWVPMSVQFLGRLRDLVLGGGGKPLLTAGDPGEPLRKPPDFPG